MGCVPVIHKGDKMAVVSTRISEEQKQYIEKIVKKEGKKKGEVTRELIKYGFYYLMVRDYKEGRLSLGKLARELSLSLSETIDLLKDLGINAPIEFEDYLKGYETLQKVF